jgi:hypothetical protein
MSDQIAEFKFTKEECKYLMDALVTSLMHINDRIGQIKVWIAISFRNQELSKLEQELDDLSKSFKFLNELGTKISFLTEDKEDEN